MKSILSFCMLGTLLILWLSCKKEGTQPSVCSCSAPAMIPFFPGYAANEVQTVVKRVYYPGSNFSRLYGEHSYSNPTTVAPSGNTSIGSLINVFEPDLSLVRGWDYELFIPAINQLIRITNISDSGTSIYCGQHPCDARINGYTITNARYTAYNYKVKAGGGDSVNNVLLAFAK